MEPSNIKMLCIDDKARLSDLDRKRYKNLGVTTTIVSSFSEVEECLNKTPYDVVVINLDQSKVDAYSTAFHLKNTEKFRELTIAITTVQDKSKALKKFKNIADLVVEFPMPSQIFVEKLRSILDKQSRKDTRINSEFSVKYVENGENKTGTIIDISSTGILLQTEHKLNSKQKIDLEFILDGYKKSFKASGQVVREISIPQNGNEKTPLIAFGVKFVEFQGDGEKRLLGFLSKQESIESKLAYYL